MSPSRTRESLRGLGLGVKAELGVGRGVGGLPFLAAALTRSQIFRFQVRQPQNEPNQNFGR